MEYINMHTRHVSGLPEAKGGSGNPSPVTAYGVFMGLKASTKFVFGSDNIAGKKVLVQGAGNVGQNLIELLLKENAEVFVTDIFEDKLAEVVAKYPKAKIVNSDNFFDLEFDIYAPCALGATVNTESIEAMKCSIIAGAANNQLKDEKIHGEALIKKGIVYAPDFLINAGGLINVYMEYIGGYNKASALAQTENIYNVTLELLKKSREEDITTMDAAKKIAEDRINSIAHIKTSYNR
jgi:leucine dehydrogenase